MNIQKFTQKSIEAVNQCEKLAYEYGNQQIEQEHLLYSLLTIEDSLILKLIQKMGMWADAAYDKERKAFNRFKGDNEAWLADYALFSAVKEYFDGDMFTMWPEDIRLRNKLAMDSYRIKLDEEIRFYEFLQFLFEQQWKKLKEYANEKGIRTKRILKISEKNSGEKKVYYISAEFLTGRFLLNTLINLQ